ncbi:diphosphomevalonate decarboxylase [Lujinxingia litoralis]|uniref:diphosphomevalonate decarboxylase n=1 Tax=Lujinxingia litoralis TaxID=2211119 RepID=A0A328C8R4_9DELT|nr:diphosphomevalonate decarboxylase [Lujinxingia litoralis]RAL21766.1 diphosphomevalonate decarboxylase [Lujinxingia litoralis]
MHATALAHSNIALVKYWGKRDRALNLPVAGSLSLTLGGLATTTTVHFRPELESDLVSLDGRELRPGSVAHRRIADFLDLVRNDAGITSFAEVETANNFPTAAGLASSASGFAALALAATHAAGQQLTDAQLSVLARRGSGSAARSIFGGFAEMSAGTRADGRDAHARALAGPEHWDLRCVVAVTTQGEKDVSSTEGMTRTQETSPLFEPWARTVDADIAQARHAVETRDFALLGRVAERSCLGMHASAMAADPGVIYWNPTTIEVIHRVRRARRDGLQIFFTIDAGPHVKVFCPARELSALRSVLSQIDGVNDLIVARPGQGAHLLES